MNIIITLAGKSKRFLEAGYSTPKFLLEIGGKTILEHIPDMFSKNDMFYFVFNKNQIRDFPEIKTIIKKSVPNYEIIEIKTHDHGPVFSAIHIKSIDKNQPVIVSYCDFLVSWDYLDFLSKTADYDMAIPSFIGLHPSSFGVTKYAYSKLNSKNELIELREKESFTNNRINEYANAGIYYFKSYNLFQSLGRELLANKPEGLDEAYVSLISNLVVSNKGKVLITVVSKFICLGTPFDYEMYKFWESFFTKKEFISNSLGMTEINLIPMAGEGSRFKKEGYNVLKPLIQIGKKVMFIKSSQTFPDAKKWIFVFKDSKKLRNSNLIQIIDETFELNKIIKINHNTSGQAATCLLAKQDLNLNKSLFIASCDYMTIYNESKWKNEINNNEIDVFIWTFKTKNIIVRNHKAFAYCKIDEDTGIVKKIIEKEVISNSPENDHMVVGSFWFRKSSDFIQSAENSIFNNVNINGEHYIGDSLNYLIRQGKKIKVFEIEKWISFGDPFELEIYNYWEDYFYLKDAKKPMN